MKQQHVIADNIFLRLFIIIFETPKELKYDANVFWNLQNTVYPVDLHKKDSKWRPAFLILYETVFSSILTPLEQQVQI